jgi:TM2 domain-containing membrane protein YozV
MARDLRGVDTERAMRYDADKKSALIAYLLWFFLGLFGVHRLYLGRVGTGLGMLVLHGISWVLAWILIGYLGFAVLGLWWLIDALLIPGMTRSYNNRLIESLRG